MHIRAVLTLAVLLVPMLSGAEVFRCTDAAGRTEYSDSACVGGTGKVVLVNQNVLPGPSPREQALVDENRRLRGELDASRSAPAPGQAIVLGRTDADLAAEKGGSFECTQARRNFEFAASSRQLYRDTRADELAVYIACGIRPPERIVNLTEVAVAGGYRPLGQGFCDRGGCRDGHPDRRPPGQVAAPIGALRGGCAHAGSRMGCL